MKRPSGFIEPCLPSLAARPPPARWIHEIKHDGFRLMGCRDAAGIRLLTRNGNDFTARYPLIVEAVAALPVRSCVVDGEAVACDGSGLSIFETLRWRHRDRAVFMWCFDLLELDGRDMRREPIEARKAARPARHWRAPRPIARASATSICGSDHQIDEPLGELRGGNAGLHLDVGQLVGDVLRA
jgi:ATP dependent DNA ligase domain